MIRFRIIGLTLAALATLAACGGKPAEPGVAGPPASNR